jgi:hypothetical protein
MTAREPLSWERIRIGIEPKELAKDELPPNPTEMRQAIFEAMHESALVRNVMYSADYQGLSAEDRYTSLAYHALVALETYYKKALQHAMLYPNPNFIMKASDT